MKKKFVSTMRKGFHMTFENGLTASVQWGAGNYCDNHYTENMEDFYCKRDMSSDTAEVAVIYKGELIDLGNFLPAEQGYDDVVCGWLSPEEVLDFLNKVREFNPAMETDVVCKHCAFIFPIKDGRSANDDVVICPNCGHHIEEVK